MNNPVTALMALGFPRGEAELMVALIVGESAKSARSQEAATRASNGESPGAAAGAAAA